MNSTSPNLVTNNPKSSRENRITHNISQNKIGISSGFNIEEFPDNTFLSLAKRDYSFNGLKTPVEWNATEEYLVGDVVRIFNGYTYTDETNTPVSCSAGVWACVCHVPNKILSDEVIAGSYDTTVYKTFIRQPNINYNPIWPEPESVANVDDNPSGSYWQLIGMMPSEISMCVDGEVQTTFIGAMASGSNNVLL